MRNHVQPGNVITFTAAAPVTSGQGVVVGSLFGVAATDAGTGDEFEAAVVGVYRLPKAAVDIAAGAKVYWHLTNNNVVTAASGARAIGAATEAAGTGAATVAVRLDGVAV